MSKRLPIRPAKAGSVSVSKQEPELRQNNSGINGGTIRDGHATGEPIRPAKAGSVSVSKQAEGSGKNFKELLKTYEAKHTNSLWAQHAAEHREDQAVPVLGLARLPTDSTERKNIPLASGVLDYFPDSLAAVAAVSKAGNDQHNPGEPLHWARGKSMDQGDTLIRHFIERGSVDVDGLRHSAKMAWRALALLQLEIEQEKGLPPSRGSK